MKVALIVFLYVYDVWELEEVFKCLPFLSGFFNLFFSGVTCTDGELWSAQRSFVVRHLRNLGFGKSPMEIMIKDEVSVILDVIKESQPDLRIGRLLAPSVLNVLWSLITGSRISRSNPRLYNLLDLFNKRSKAFDMSGGTLSQHPWLRFVAPEMTGFNLLNNINKELSDFFMEIIMDHHKTWRENCDDDLIYSFISEMRSKDESSYFTSKYIDLC